MATAGAVVTAGRTGTPETAAAALRRQAVERSTGVLEISGPDRAPAPEPRGPHGPVGSSGPRGRIHLVDGRVAYAEATAVPGVDVRLVRAGLVSETRWRSLVRALDTGRVGGSGGAGDALVDVTRSAGVTDEVLERIVRSATIDAAVALLGGAQGAGGRCRFRPGAGSWSGWACRTAMDDLLDEAAAGLRVLAASAVGPDDTVVLRAAGADGVVLAPPLTAVLVAVAEGGTPRQAAWQAGLAMLDAVAALADLVDQGAGAVVVRRPRPGGGGGDAAERQPRSGPSTTPGSPPAPAVPTELAPLPCRRRPQIVRPVPGHEPVLATTDTGILTRLIEGLRGE